MGALNVLRVNLNKKDVIFIYIFQIDFREFHFNLFQNLNKIIDRALCDVFIPALIPHTASGCLVLLVAFAKFGALPIVTGK